MILPDAPSFTIIRKPLGAQMVKNQPAMQETQVQFLGQKDPPLKKRMAAHSSVLPWRIPWIEKHAGYSPWGHQKLANT